MALNYSSAVAFSRVGEPAIGEFDDAAVLSGIDDVPSDGPEWLSEALHDAGSPNASALSAWAQLGSDDRTFRASSWRSATARRRIVFVDAGSVRIFGPAMKPSCARILRSALSSNGVFELTAQSPPDRETEESVFKLLQYGMLRDMSKGDEIDNLKFVLTDKGWDTARRHCQ